ncbi:hypothetical protein [Labrenzia sp. OB1]|uniref:hypothetical protein n=1 Tax=Labrenzia sp. OB1 TaxID=1561204 RepID=UPI0012E8835B|nr:hypothetical protein [Labrenzia sp. OB1]
MLDKIVICPAGESKLKYKIFTGESGALSRIEYSIEIDMSKQTEKAYNAMKAVAAENSESLKLVKALQVNAVIGVGNGSIALNELDCTFERF